MLPIELLSLINSLHNPTYLDVYYPTNVKGNQHAAQWSYGSKHFKLN